MFRVLLVLATAIAASHGDANCNTADILCLNAIKAAASNTSLFWFGTDYARNCPPNKRFMLKCSNSRPDIADSLQSRIFDGSYTDTNLDRTLTVSYNSPAGDYKACGNHYSEKQKSFSLNPITGPILPTWYFRMAPSVSWTPEADTQYTLVVIDAPYGWTHGIFVNIAGGDISKGEVFKPYHGPRNMMDKINPYVFVLFKQTNKNITVNPMFKSAFMTFNMTKFAQMNALVGPIAMNWIHTVGDAYAVEGMKKQGILNNCVMLVSKAARKHSRPWLPSDVTFSLSVDITFNTKPISFKSCCKEHSYGARSFSLNPVGKEVFSTAETRTEGTTRDYAFTMAMPYFNATAAFAGKMWTMLMVDPDVPVAAVGTSARPLLHMVVLNIPDGMVSQGEVFLDYQGPTPPDNKPHHYYYLVYEQQGKLTNTSYLQHVGNCPARLAGRCLFDVQAFVSGNNLRLLGASWMVAKKDPYVHYRQLKRGDEESTVCAGVQGYGNPCPTGSAVPVSHGLFVTLLMLVLSTAL